MGKSTTSGVQATNVTVQGAGEWYSTLYSNPNNPSSGGQMIGGVGATLQNFTLDANSTYKGCASATGMSGDNWAVDTVWVRHLSLAVWGGGSNGIIKNMRVNNTWSDGINLNNFSGNSKYGSNLTATNNFLRFTGDDSLAINGTDASGHTPMNGITIANNTIVQTAGRIVVYGGNNIVIKNNLAHDVIQNDGIQVGYHQQTANISNVLVLGNVLFRCGNAAFGGEAEMLIGTQSTTYDDNGTTRSYIDTGINVIGNVINDAYFGALEIQICTNVTIADNVIISPQLDGIHTVSFSTGNAVLDDNMVSGLGVGQPMFYNNSSGNYAVSSTVGTMVRPPVEAASYNSLSSARAYREPCSEGGEDLTGIYNGDYAVYGNVNLTGINSFVARVASANAGGNMEIHLDSPSGTLVGTCAVTNTGGGQTWNTVTCNVSGASGYHDVYLVFTGGGGDLVNVSWFALLGNGNRTEAAGFYSAPGLQTENCVEGGLDVTNIYKGTYAVFNQVNLTGASSFNARVANAGSGGSIQIRLDCTNGTLIGTCTVSPTGGWQTWSTATCALNASATGCHNVYLVFTGGGGTLFNLEWIQFQFNSATATPSNLALNQPVVASSTRTSDGVQAAWAVDGNLNTRWGSEYSDPQWIYVDLGANYNISGVTIDWQNSYAKAYQIQVSTNASTWTTIYSETNNAGGTENLTGLSGFGRYVRMYGTVRSNPTFGYSLWELEVFGNAAQPSVTAQVPPLGIQSASASQGLTLQWPDNGNRELASQPNIYYTPGLTPPVVWTPVTNLLVFSNGQWMATLPATNTQGFYRLQQ